MSEVPPAQSTAGDPAHGPLPRVFGHYVLFDQIGRGGMADIYLARADNELGGSRLVVVKQILPELTRDAAFERMFVSEAKLAAELRNTNIVQVFDLGREGERLFIGMEYVEGFDLHQLLRELSRARVPLPAEFAIFIVREVLSALSYAHRCKRSDGQPLGIVHRDVSPSNVLISFEGEVKLCDFGIARALTARGSAAQEEPGVVSSTRVVGKSAYMAPEQARGEPLDARADVFAAGILLWELCAGRRLYKGSEKEMLELARAAQVPMLPDRGLPAQEKLQKVLDRALARYRDDRYQSAADMQRALDDYTAEARLVASQLRFGSFLTEHFGEKIIETRRAHERAARDLRSIAPPDGEPGSEASGGGAEGGATLIDNPPSLSSMPVDESRNHGSGGNWQEPGSLRAPAAAKPHGQVQVVEPGAADRTVEPLGPVDPEVEAKLDALSAIDGSDPRPDGQVDQRTSRPAAAAKGVSDRLLYLAAVLILAVGVAVYLWR